MLKKWLTGLTPLQITIVTALFFPSATLAVIAAMAFRWWNAR